MEYNCQREQLRISDYGRNVAKLIAYAKSIEDREQRTKVAYAIVEVMGKVNPLAKDTADYRKKLWHHMMTIAEWELDVDSPFPLERPSDVQNNPRSLPYKDHNMHYRHYGSTMEKMIKKVAEMDDNEERSVLTDQIAHAMKRSYLTWNSDTVEDQVILDQLSHLSDGKLHPSEQFQFNKEYATEKAELKTKVKNRKKKK